MEIKIIVAVIMACGIIFLLRDKFNYMYLKSQMLKINSELNQRDEKQIINDVDMIYRSIDIENAFKEWIEKEYIIFRERELNQYIIEK